MRVLAAHNYYQQRGGEDQCFEDMVQALRENGHEVLTHTVHNDVIGQRSRTSVALQSIWNRQAAREMERLLRSFQPDVVHLMNTFPLLSPAVACAAKRLGFPVVFEIQNYRLACAAGVLLRKGAICEKCLGRSFPWSALQHRCYRDSLSGTLPLAIGIAVHRWLGFWTRYCDLFVCPSQTTRDKLVAAGLPEPRIRIKPNALHYDPGVGQGTGNYVAFVGRLSPEKGLETLIEAWNCDSSLPELKVIGNGPMADWLQSRIKHDTRIQWLGGMKLEQLLELVGEARFLVMPSIWYEPFGRTTIESLAKGTPVIGTRIGGTAEIVSDGVDGYLTKPGDAVELASTIRQGFRLSSAQIQCMRQAAREKFLQKFTTQANYQALSEIYNEVRELALNSSR